jgi:hypothetical protein
MLEIRKNPYDQNYENSFFRIFSRSLFEKFEQNNLEGVLLGNPLCEKDNRLQIDALLITSKVICLIDFKNYGGQIKLPNLQDFESDLGLWLCEDGSYVKGGNCQNPFIQLKIQKKRFIKIFQNYIERNLNLDDSCNPYHTIRIVCFHKLITLQNQVPNKHEKNFKILDSSNYLEGLLDIIEIDESDTHLTQESFNAFKQIFQAEEYNFNNQSSINAFEESIQDKFRENSDLLYEDQKEALTQFNQFLKEDKKQVFIIQGTSNSGKSFLIPYLENIAHQQDIPEVLLFVQSKRVARNLMYNYNLTQVESIYSYIYGGQPQLKESQDQDIELSDQVVESNLEDIDELKVIPLKQCDMSDNAIIIVDEAHLLSDSYYEGFDLRFGSGYLLKDFLEFVSLHNSSRKIVFIGDPFQLSFGKSDESPLNPKYLEENYNLSTAFVQLLDKENYSPITTEALKCVAGIRHKIFNNLQISEIPQTIIHLPKTEVGHYLAQQNKFQIHVLCYSNAKAHEVNLWIKKKIVKTGEKLDIGDILFLNNNITVTNNDDPFTPKTKLYNGDFVEVISVLNPIKIETRKIKDIEITLKFQEIIVKLLDAGKQVKILILLNYLENPQGELSKEEIIVLKILLNTYLQKELANHLFEKSVDYENLQKSGNYQLLVDEIENLKLKLQQGEKVKTQLNEKEKELRKLEKSYKKQHRYKIQQRLENDSSCEYFKLKNVAQVRYGWAMTVHKSMSYKWKTLVFNNADQGDNRGKANKDYFQWLYTGITRATEQLILYGCDPITPLSNSHISMIDRSGQNIESKWVQSYFVATQDTELFNAFLGKLNPELHQYFNNLEPKDSIHLVDFCLFILPKLQESQLKINKIVHKPYQEIYEIVRDDKTARISIYYNQEGIFKKPSLQKSNDSEFGQRILHDLDQNTALSEIVLTKQDQWREKFYQKLIDQLQEKELYLTSLIEKDYHDLLRLFQSDQILCIKLDYNNQGFISTITAIYYTCPSLWDAFQSVIKEYQ